MLSPEKRVGDFASAAVSFVISDPVPGRRLTGSHTNAAQNSVTPSKTFFGFRRAVRYCNLNTVRRTRRLGRTWRVTPRPCPPFKHTSAKINPRKRTARVQLPVDDYLSRFASGRVSFVPHAPPQNKKKNHPPELHPTTVCGGAVTGTGGVACDPLTLANLSASALIDTSGQLF